MRQRYQTAPFRTDGRGELILKRCDTLETALEEYLLACRIEGKSAKTLVWYQQKLEYLTKFLKERGHSTRIDDIGKDDLRAFINHLQTDVRADANHPTKPSRDRGLSPQTIVGYCRTLRAFFRWLIREGYLAESPMEGIKLPRLPQSLMRSFTEAEVRSLLDSFYRHSGIGFRDYTMTMVLLDTGVRASELVGLELRDLHLEQGYFKVLGKGRKERIVPLGRTAQRTLWRYLNRYRPAPALPSFDNVFLTRDGWPMKTDWLYKIIAHACPKAGISGSRVGPHTLRHTFARNFLMNGGDLLTLQRILGHSSLEVVRLYVNLDTRDLLKQQRAYSPVDNLVAKSGARQAPRGKRGLPA